MKINILYADLIRNYPSDLTSSIKLWMEPLASPKSIRVFSWKNKGFSIPEYPVLIDLVMLSPWSMFQPEHLKGSDQMRMAGKVY